DGQNLVPAQQIKEAAEEETVLPGEIEGVQIKFGKARGRDRHGDILGQARAKLRLERIEENADDLLAALEMVIEVARADAEILRDARHARRRRTFPVHEFEAQVEYALPVAHDSPPVFS